MTIVNWLGKRTIGSLLVSAALSGLMASHSWSAPPAFHREANMGSSAPTPGWLRPPAKLGKSAAVEPATAEPTETVRERYENGTIKVEREVVLNDEGDFVSHGKYREYSPSGRVVRQGEFNQDRMEGVWQWAFRPGEATLFAGPYEQNFQGPFLSQATFRDDKLHGTWTITDRFGHKVIEWNFEDGVRTGRSTWSYPNGHVRRQVDYRNDVEEGTLTEWSPNGQLIRTETVGGGRMRQQVSWHSPGHKAAEGSRYVARQEVAATYDWWNGTVSIEPVGEQVQDAMHGVWTFYHPNGQVQMRGEYDHDQPVGKFTWWHANGVKQAEGEYDQGHRIAKWTSWHANGRRESQGHYADDVAVGQWTYWADDGSVESVDELGLGESQLVDSFPSNDGAAKDQAPQELAAEDSSAEDFAPEPEAEPAPHSQRVTRRRSAAELQQPNPLPRNNTESWEGAEGSRSLPKFGTSRRSNRQ